MESTDEGISLEVRKIASELGKRGGLKTLEKYGKGHFKKLIKKRWSKRDAV